MKITELRCSACDGTLKIDENNPNMAVCEYCHSKFTIEWDRSGIAGGNPSLKPLPGKIAYTPVKKEEPKRTGWEPYGWKRGVALVIAFFVILGVWKGPAVYRRYQSDKAQNDASAAAEVLAEKAKGLSLPGTKAGGGDASSAAEPLSADTLLGAFAERVFEKTADEISEKELSGIRWLEFRSSLDYKEVGYSLESPFENPEAELTWVSFPRNEYYDDGLDCLPLFSGLRQLKVNGSLTADRLKGLSLQGLEGYFDSLEGVAQILEHPENMKSLNLTGDTIKLEGIQNFTSLETLILNCDTVEGEKLLVDVPSLKTLSLELYDGSMDFMSLGVISQLEALDISSKNLKDISFVSKLPNLASLRLEYGNFLSLEPLGGMTNLRELSVERCDELKDMSAIGGLTGLTSLRVDLPYDCPAPDLSGLTSLESLYLEGFDEIGFLRNMTNLTELTLDGCGSGDVSSLTGLVNLKRLTCTAFGYRQQDYGFITGFPALEYLNISGTMTYDDISGVFNMPTLRELSISSMECEINFDRIQENTSLETLNMNKLKLYKNVSVSGGGGIYSVNWDDVTLTEHLDFLAKLKGLQNLSIRENQLTDISFAAGLEALRTIDFSDNYVTDLSPLMGLKALRQVTCTDNPISNYDVLGGSVEILR